MVKSLITILFLFNTAFGQHYFIVPTLTNPNAKALLVSKRFYQLSRPVKGGDVTEYLLAIYKHPVNDSFCIEIDTAFNLRKGSISASHITAWIDETYPSITTQQRNTLTNYLNNNTILRIANLILTSRIKLWTRQEMLSRGWFAETPIH